MDLLPDAVLRYADHDEAVFDVHLPEHTSGAVVVLVHGGFWKAEWDRTHTRPLARTLADEGFVVASPEYRRVGNGGGWPTTAEDVRRALTALPDLLGALEVTSTRTTLVGHSAGGHLVLWLASEVAVDRVVGLAPVCDLREAARLGLGANATRAFLGGGPEEVDYDPADPMVRLDERPDADVVIVHGNRDENVPLDLSRRFVERHPWVRLVELGCGHFELIDPDDPAYEAVRAALG
jgi:acetyl esterase/lipase